MKIFPKLSVPKFSVTTEHGNKRQYNGNFEKISFEFERFDQYIVIRFRSLVVSLEKSSEIPLIWPEKCHTARTFYDTYKLCWVQYSTCPNDSSILLVRLTVRICLIPRPLHVVSSLYMRCEDHLHANLWFLSTKH